MTDRAITDGRGGEQLDGMLTCNASQSGVRAVRDAVGAGDTTQRGTRWCDCTAHPGITAAPPRGRTVKVARSAHLAQLGHAEAGASGGGALCGGAPPLPLAGAGAAACTQVTGTRPGRPGCACSPFAAGASKHHSCFPCCRAMVKSSSGFARGHGIGATHPARHGQARNEAQQQSFHSAPARACPSGRSRHCA